MVSSKEAYPTVTHRGQDRYHVWSPQCQAEADTIGKVRQRGRALEYNPAPPLPALVILSVNEKNDPHKARNGQPSVPSMGPLSMCLSTHPRLSLPAMHSLVTGFQIAFKKNSQEGATVKTKPRR